MPDVNLESKAFAQLEASLRKAKVSYWSRFVQRCGNCGDFMTRVQARLDELHADPSMSVHGPISALASSCKSLGLRCISISEFALVDLAAQPRRVERVLPITARGRKLDVHIERKLSLSHKDPHVGAQKLRQIQDSLWLARHPVDLLVSNAIRRKAWRDAAIRRPREFGSLAISPPDESVLRKFWFKMPYQLSVRFRYILSGAVITSERTFRHKFRPLRGALRSGPPPPCPFCKQGPEDCYHRHTQCSVLLSPRQLAFATRMQDRGASESLVLCGLPTCADSAIFSVNCLFAWVCNLVDVHRAAQAKLLELSLL
jgi:hypothetical protein